MPEELKLVFDLVKHQASVVNTIWGLWMTASVAVVGWFVSAGKDKLVDLTASARWAIALAFLAFTLVNAYSLAANYGILDSLLADAHAMMRQPMTRLPETARALEPPFSAVTWGKLGFPYAIFVQLAGAGLVIGLVLMFGRKVGEAARPAALTHGEGSSGSRTG